MKLPKILKDNPVILIGLVIFLVLLVTPIPGDELIGLLTMAFGAAMQIMEKKKKRKGD